MRRLVALIVLACGVGVPLAFAQPRLPDPSTGSVDGKVATLVWPAKYRDAKTWNLLPVEGCVAYFVPRSDLDAVHSYPCGQWVAPAPGWYKIWMETNGLISPAPLRLHYAGSKFQGNGLRAVAPVVPAGFIRLSDEVAVPRDQGLRLVSLRADGHFLDWTPAFDRRVPDPRQRVAMPAGVVLAGIFDRKSGDAVALARPADVGAGKSVVVRPAPPERHSDVLVIFRRPTLPARDAMRLQLTDARGARAPDAMLDAVDMVVAVWYGATGKRATVTFESERLMLRPVELTLTPKRVTTHRGELQMKPGVKVSVFASPEAFKEMSLTIHRLGSKEPIRVVPVSREPSYAIEGLPAEQLRVTLTADRWTFHKDIDLRDGTDGVVAFTLDPVVLRGKVSLAGEPARATLSFGDGTRELVNVETDEAGAYEAVFWEEALYVANVKLKDDDAEPFIDPAVPVERSRTVDFDLPGNRVTAVVIDAQAGTPIGGAAVGVTIEATHAEVGAMAMSLRHTADADGKVVLPRLRPGIAKVAASAQGYATSDPVSIEVEATTKRELRFALKRLEALRRLIVLPDGTPAAGAEAIVVSDPTAGRVVWSGTAAAGGELDIAAPDRSGIVIVRHPSAASRAVPLSSDAEKVLLAAADPEPLVIRSTDSNDSPVRFALLTVWVDGLRLCDRAAAFATWSAMPLTDADGVWTGRNLPPAPLRLLVTKNVSPGRIATAAYDALAETIPYPRPGGPVTVKAAE